LGVEAPRCQDAATKAYRAYFEELQRRQRGWIGAQMGSLPPSEYLS